MIITMKKTAPQAEADKIVKNLEAKGLSVTLIRGTDYNVFGVVGDTTGVDEKIIAANPYVDNVQRVAAPYKRANRLFHEADTVVDVSGVKVGGREKIVVIGGPCSVEGREPLLEIAREVRRPAAPCCGAAPTSPAPPPTTSRAWGPKGLPTCGRPGRPPACPSSAS